MDLSLSDLQGSFPSCVLNLTSLTELDLNGNRLSGYIAGDFSLLTHLTYLDLSDNYFNSSIPSTFGNMQNLEHLHLENNDLSGPIPYTLGNLTKLIHLDVSNNSLMGELSESVLEGLRSLEELDISRNKNLVFNVSPKWIPPFQLLSITMDSIFIGTQFPQWLQHQTNLSYLDMYNVSIFGVVPDSFPTTNPNLKVIDLSNNLLIGPVPAFVSASLRYLKLNGNQFSGNIPQQFCNLKSLEYLSLRNNQLIGRIPSCLGALPSLLVLDLGNNSLSGHIPYEFGSLSSLISLHLNENKFSGELPSPFLTSLRTFDVGDNKLQGSIPIWIGKDSEEWPSLQYLRLESNNFSGQIPLNLCQLKSLQILNLAVNIFVGTIPPCLGNLSMMLDESQISGFRDNFDQTALSNYIKGLALQYTSSLKYAKFISLSGNHLHGEIPNELMNLEGLQSLNLSNNDLTGIIPETINKLKFLESLDLSMNRLFGNIPQSLADIDALGYLNLSFNNFAGRIPSGNYFDTLKDPSSYEGNTELCGKPLMKSCLGENSATSNQPNGQVPAAADEDELDQMSWMYAGIGPGFAVGFLGVICSLYSKDQWRIAFFSLIENVYNEVRETFTINISQFWSKFN